MSSEEVKIFRDRYMPSYRTYAPKLYAEGIRRLRTHVAVMLNAEERFVVSACPAATSEFCLLYVFDYYCYTKLFIVENGLLSNRETLVCICTRQMFLVIFFATVEFFSGAPRFIDYSPL